MSTLSIRRRRPRRNRSSQVRIERPAATYVNACCSMHFMSVPLFNGQRFRLLTLVNNGPECISKSPDWCTYFNRVRLDFSRPGMPTDNAFIESFNGNVRQECLNEYWFVSLEDAQEKLNLWQDDYNRQRPHSALRNATPEEFAAQSMCRRFPEPCLEVDD